MGPGLPSFGGRKLLRKWPFFSFFLSELTFTHNRMKNVTRMLTMVKLSDQIFISFLADRIVLGSSGVVAYLGKKLAEKKQKIRPRSGTRAKVFNELPSLCGRNYDFVRRRPWKVECIHRFFFFVDENMYRFFHTFSLRLVDEGSERENLRGVLKFRQNCFAIRIRITESEEKKTRLTQKWDYKNGETPRRSLILINVWDGGTESCCFSFISSFFFCRTWRYQISIWKKVS